MYALNANSVRYMEEYTMSAGIPGNVLMELAGKSVAEEITGRFPDSDTSILVLCGSGKNGADGLVCTRWLLNKGNSNIRILFLGTRGKICPEFLEQTRILQNANPNIKIEELISADSAIVENDYEVIVDSIYGIGINRNLKDEDRRLIEYINGKSSYRIAVDIPSGLDASSGRPMGAAIRSNLTVTFGTYKSGMFLGRGRDFCGEIKLIDIGLLEKGFKNITDKMTVCDMDFYESTVSDALLKRDESGHKGSFGTVGIVVSSEGMLGATILAARSAYRSGCGLVKVFCPRECVQTLNSSVAEAVAVPYDSKNPGDEASEFINSVDAVLIGPGLSEDRRGDILVDKVLAGRTPAVLDAGALNLLSAHPDRIKRRHCQCVITPHIGEMAKLCGSDKNTISENIVKYTNKFSQEYMLSLVVKSNVSIISIIKKKGGNDLFLNITGNSGLATAGSGDVLAGAIASLTAQGNSLDTSLLYGVMTHGIAANKAALTENMRRRMVAGDIVDNLFL